MMMMEIICRWLPAGEVQRSNEGSISEERKAQGSQEEPQDPNGDDKNENGDDDNDDDNDDDDDDDGNVTVAGKRPGVHQELSRLLPLKPHYWLAWWALIWW